MIIKGILWGMVFSVALVDAMAIFILLLIGATIDNIFIYVMFGCVILMAFLGATIGTRDEKKIKKGSVNNTPFSMIKSRLKVKVKNSNH